jgi:type IV secretory pathway TrbF-like protein
VNSTSTNGTATIPAEEEPPVADPYALAAASAEADQKNEERRTDTFRRQNIFQYVIIVLLSVTSFIGLFTHKVEVKVVYDHNGTLVDGGTAAALATPTDANIAAAIAQYIMCLRSVSNDDLRADECKSLVEDVMTQNVPPAHARDDVEAWYQKNNPKWLARDETRTVLNDRDHPVKVLLVGGHTYYVHWFERLHSFQRGDSYSDHTASVVIAPPFIPTDDTLRTLDPPAVIVTSSDGVLI